MSAKRDKFISPATKVTGIRFGSFKDPLSHSQVNEYIFRYNINAMD